MDKNVEKAAYELCQLFNENTHQILTFIEHALAHIYDVDNRIKNEKMVRIQDIDTISGASIYFLPDKKDSHPTLFMNTKRNFGFNRIILILSVYEHCMVKAFEESKSESLLVEWSEASEGITAFKRLFINFICKALNYDYTLYCGEDGLIPSWNHSTDTKTYIKTISVDKYGILFHKTDDSKEYFTEYKHEWQVFAKLFEIIEKQK